VAAAGRTAHGCQRGGWDAATGGELEARPPAGSLGRDRRCGARGLVARLEVGAWLSAGGRGVVAGWEVGARPLRGLRGTASGGEPEARPSSWRPGGWGGAVVVVSWARRTGELCVVVSVGDLAFGPSLFSSTNLQLMAGRVAVGPSLRRQGTARGYRVDAVQVDRGREAALC
jgi:hypothetical protein